MTAAIRCFGCRTKRESIEDLIPVPGRGDRDPRHFCEPCAYRMGRIDP